MCFTVAINQHALKIAQRKRLTIDELSALFLPNTKILGFTHPNLLIVKNTNPGMLTTGQWGLYPEWAKDDSIQKHTLNARIETLNEKPSFAPYIENRCIIIIDGFYEWQWLSKSGSKKQQYYVEAAQEATLTLAGLWHVKNNITTFSIITQPANTLMAAIHNTKQRMPLIIPDNQEHLWLEKGEYSLADDNTALKATAINQVQARLFDF